MICCFSKSLKTPGLSFFSFSIDDSGLWLFFFEGFEAFRNRLVGVRGSTILHIFGARSAASQAARFDGVNG